MANEYTTLLNAPLTLTGNVPPSPARTRGEAIITEYNRRRNLMHPVPAFDMTLLMNCLHQRFQADGWQWVPNSGAKADGRQALEGRNVRNQGQCAVLAGALYALLICPHPFGCGQVPGLNDRVDSYNNGGLGFISAHPLAGIFSLPAHVYNTHGVLQGRYLWDNHYVVAYQGDWYDPSYNLVYNNAISDMAAEDLTTGETQEASGDSWFRTNAGLYVRCSETDYFGPGQGQFNITQRLSGPWNSPYDRQNNNYVRPPQGRPRPRNNGGCYITTATCLALGKKDNCDELEALRWYRDNVLIKSKDGAKAAIEYYRSAKNVIDTLNQQSEREAKEIYQHIYDKYVAPAVKAVTDKDYPKAKAIFLEALADMKGRFPNETSSEMAVRSLSLSSSGIANALSTEFVTLNGMKVLFDRPVPTTPVNLIPKEEFPPQL
ncbi:hypothetical protein [Baaleninema simplex]|uniref:hypothetical protein n=1 Tax=Baaleninema simplex TaxID=2862350 RepID=UPI000347A63C|nr:hypothetical protein [Baaleninema simplex]